jgi:choline kinase
MNEKNKEPILLVMAAGIGSRYGGLKQLDPIGYNEEKIIDFSVYDAIRAGFKRVIFIVRDDIKDLFDQVIGQQLKKHIQVEYAVQSLEDVPFPLPEGRVKPFGTAHAVYSARALIDAPFAAINADDYYGPEGFKALYDFLIKTEAQSHCMVGFKLKNTVSEHGYVSRGVCTVKNHQLVDVEEKLRIEIRDGDIQSLEDTWESLDKDTIVSMNMWGFHHSIVDNIERLLHEHLQRHLETNPLKGEYYLPFVVNEALQHSETVEVFEVDEKWYGVTYKEDKAFVVKAIQNKIDQNMYPRKLWG